MAHQSFLFLLTSLLLSLQLTHANEPSVTLFKLESQSSIDGLKVTIQCITSGSISGNRTFFRARELNSSDVERVRSLEGSGNEILLTFELTPMLEGYYFCQVGNLTSNKLPLVAYPVLNRNLRNAGVTNSLSVPLGRAISVPCPYERGMFEERYGVTWYQGVHVINTSAMQFNRYEILRDFSLMIQDVKPGDASNAYYCQVRVNTTDDVVVRQSPYITVEVLDPITISQHLQEQIVAPNSIAQYICKISGVPAPTIKWTFNGEEISESTSIHIENNTTTLRNIVTVTSTLRYLSSQMSGQVACIGYHMEGDRLVMVTSEAHLIVLTDQFSPDLSVDEESPRLRIQFPSLIPGQFELMAYYYYQNMNAYSRKLISHPRFRNTREVDIAVPADKLPPFRTFTVQIALSVANKTGSRSTRSNQITFNKEFPSGTTTDVDCYCPDTGGVQPSDSKSSDSDSPVVALLAVFIVLLIILIIVCTVVGVMFCVCYRRMKSFPLDKLDEASNVNGGGHFSEASNSDITNDKGPHLYNDTPASTLQRSRKGSISSHGSQAGAESADDNEEENPNDNFDHKKLEQWEEKKAVAMDTMEVDDETGIRMHSNEYHPTRVEYQRRKQLRGGGELHYVTNIAMRRHPSGQDTTPAATANVKSADSFEDLTYEFEQMKTTKSADFSKSA